MEKKINTTIEFELVDGTVVPMTLTFYAIYQLKSKNKALYDRYNKIMTKGAQDELDMITVLYTAYCCANAEPMDEEDFIYALGCDRKAVVDAMKKLTQPKKP